MWVYRIVKTDAWFNVYKKLEKDWMMYVWYLWYKNWWVLNKNDSKLFYDKEDALSALAYIKYKDGKDAD